MSSCSVMKNRRPFQLSPGGADVRRPGFHTFADHVYAHRPPSFDGRAADGGSGGRLFEDPCLDGGGGRAVQA